MKPTADSESKRLNVCKLQYIGPCRANVHLSPRRLLGADLTPARRLSVRDPPPSPPARVCLPLSAVAAFYAVDVDGARTRRRRAATATRRACAQRLPTPVLLSGGRGRASKRVFQGVQRNWWRDWVTAMITGLWYFRGYISL